MHRVSLLCSQVTASASSVHSDKEQSPSLTPADEHVHGQGASSSDVSSSDVDKTKTLVITIVGSGNYGHTCAALFHENMNGNAQVQLLVSDPQEWTYYPKVLLPCGRTQTGFLTKISNEPIEMLEKTDMLLWTGPVSSMKSALESVVPFCKSTVIVGTIFAQGLTHILASRIFGNSVPFFAFRNIPWMCRIKKVGASSEIVSTKNEVEVAIMNLKPSWVTSVLGPLFQLKLKDGAYPKKISVLPDFSSIVFNPANQVIHPVRYWTLFRKYNDVPLPKKPSQWIYRDIDETAGVFMEQLDEELTQLRKRYFELTEAPEWGTHLPLRDLIIREYANHDQITDTSTLAKVIGTNKVYRFAECPMKETEHGYSPDPDHRVIKDDICWGLCVLLSIAERMEDLGVSTPTTIMRMLVNWHQKIMSKEFLVNGKLQGKDCKSLVLLGRSDPLELATRLPLYTQMLREVDNDQHYGNP